jgi:CRP-like cAMP-binding protein
VTETNWRATRLRSPEGNAIIMPNSKLAAAQIVNYAYPSTRYQSGVKIVLDIRVPPERASAALCAGALDSPRVLADPPPRAQLREYRDNTVLWEVQYWVDGFDDSPQVKDEVARGIWTALALAEIGPGVFADKPPRPAQPGGSVAEARRMLGHVDLFRDLDAATQDELAAAMHWHAFHAGETVMRRGDAAESLYIVASGMLDVRIEVPDRGRTVAARIGAAEVVGEMSLLTGSPRSADVVALVDSTAYEVAKAALAPILRRQPDLAARLGDIVAARRTVNVALEAAIAPEGHRDAARAERAEVLARMREFFGLE